MNCKNLSIKYILSVLFGIIFLIIFIYVEKTVKQEISKMVKEDSLK